MVLGDLPVKSKNLPLRYKPIRQLFIYVPADAEGAPTAPELIARCDGAVLEDEQKAFERTDATLRRARARDEAGRASGVRRSVVQRDTAR